LYSVVELLFVGGLIIMSNFLSDLLVELKSVFAEDEESLFNPLKRNTNMSFVNYDYDKEV
jgi:hypothetical protein